MSVTRRAASATTAVRTAGPVDGTGARAAGRVVGCQQMASAVGGVHSRSRDGGVRSITISGGIVADIADNGCRKAYLLIGTVVGQ